MEFEGSEVGPSAGGDAGFLVVKMFQWICHSLLTVIIPSFSHLSSWIDSSNSLKLEKGDDYDENVTVRNRQQGRKY